MGDIRAFSEVDVLISRFFHLFCLDALLLILSYAKFVKKATQIGPENESYVKDCYMMELLWDTVGIRWLLADKWPRRASWWAHSVTESTKCAGLTHIVSSCIESFHRMDWWVSFLRKIFGGGFNYSQIRKLGKPTLSYECFGICFMLKWHLGCLQISPHLSPHILVFRRRSHQLLIPCVTCW